jgi:coatomer protein complex subunit alpha (xenin)
LSATENNNEAADAKRSPGVAAIWVARNRFAVLDKSHQITIRDLSNKDSRNIEYNGAVADIFYAGTGLLLLQNAESIQIYDIQQKRVLATAKVSKVLIILILYSMNAEHIYRLNTLFGQETWNMLLFLASTPLLWLAKNSRFD